MSATSPPPVSAPQAPSSTPSTTTKPAEKQESASKSVDAELEQLLSREASAFQREMEVERILKAFKLNPYDILDLQTSATPEEIKKKYRQLSLFIHPDKTPHERAPEAFDHLKKAESELSDPAKREILDATIIEARNQVLRELELPITISDGDARLRAPSIQPPFKDRLRQKSKDLLIEEEVRRRKAIKMNLANEGLEARKKEEEIASRKRKAEEDKAWEESREQRVGSWRNFASGAKKKKKAKVAVLG